MPPPGDLPDPWIEPKSLMSPAFACGFFTTGTTWKAYSIGQKHYIGKIKPPQGHYGLLMPVCVLNTNLWAQLKFSGRESGWVGFSPLTPSTVAMVHCLSNRECGENSLRNRCGQACGDEHISEKRSKDWGCSPRAASLWMTETLKANVSEMW